MNFKFKNIIFALLLGYFLIPSFASAGFRMPPNNLGLVGYWAMNDATGTKATDYSGNGNTGTLTNFALSGATSNWLSGSNCKRSSCLNFDGTNDYVDFGSSNTLNLSSGGTISIWFRQLGDASGLYQPFIQRFGASVTGYQIYSYNSNDNICFYTNGTVCSTYVISDSNWHHLVVTNNGSTTTFYVDGVASGSGSQSAVNITTATVNNIGNYAGNYFNGSLDEVRVYSRPFTGTEVTNLYNSGVAKFKTASANGLVGYWAFEDGSGTKATDGSGNNRTGTLTGGVTWTAGKRGTAVTLNGTSGYISAIPNLDASAGITNTLSVSAWVKRNAFGVNGDRVILGRTNGSWGLIFTADDKLQSTKVGMSAGNISTSAITDSNWHHVVWTANGTTETYYIDGVPSGGGANTATYSSSGDLYDIGSRNGDIFFNGTYDEMRVYNRELTSTEITNLYNSGKAKLNASTAGRGGNLTSGLVGHWTFDGSKLTTTTATDSSTSANNGTLTNGPVPTQGKRGQALSFIAGSPQLVDTGTKFSSITSVITVSAWVKPGGTQDAYADIFGNHQNDFKGFVLQQNAGTLNQYTFGYGTGSTFITSNLFNLVTDVWQHVTIVKDATSLYVYVDGVSVVAPVSATLDIVPAATINFRMGQGYASGGRYWNGSIDDVRVYNRALTAEEVLQLYNLR